MVFDSVPTFQPYQCRPLGQENFKAIQQVDTTTGTPDLSGSGQGLPDRFTSHAKTVATQSSTSHNKPMLEVSIRVQRSTPAEGRPASFETHAVQVAPKASVLDALFALQCGPCPDLAFRFSCRVGMCGSCAMVVNGRECLACTTLISTIGPELRIQPLRNLPVTCDLAVDLKPFFQAYQLALPHFIPRDDLDPDDFMRIPHDSPEWRSLSHQPQCIDCGSCYSACTLVTLNPRYLGPMALHRALNLIVDPRDKARTERLAAVAGETGAFRCHTLGNCRDACPRGISPTHSIERLKRLLVLDQIRLLFAKVFRSQKSAPLARQNP